jgi:hypothetical protein
VQFWWFLLSNTAQQKLHLSRFFYAAVCQSTFLLHPHSFPADVTTCAMSTRITFFGPDRCVACSDASYQLTRGARRWREKHTTTGSRPLFHLTRKPNQVCALPRFCIPDLSFFDIYFSTQPRVWRLTRLVPVRFQTLPSLGGKLNSTSRSRKKYLLQPTRRVRTLFATNAVCWDWKWCICSIILIYVPSERIEEKKARTPFCSLFLFIFVT